MSALTMQELLRTREALGPPPIGPLAYILAHPSCRASLLAQVPGVREVTPADRTRFWMWPQENMLVLIEPGSLFRPERAVPIWFNDQMDPGSVVVVPVSAFSLSSW